MSWWTCLFPVAALLLVAPETQARAPEAGLPTAKTKGASPASDVSRADRERAAKRACLTGDPEGGVALLTDLYIETNDPTYLFNQGRCFEQNRRYEDAIGRFREYLIKAKGQRPEDRAETEEHIAACESYLGGKPGEAAKSDAPPAAPDHTLPQAIAATPEPSPGRAGSGLRAAGLVAAGMGAAGLLTGLVLNLKVNSMSDDLEDEYDPGVDSTRKSYKTALWIGYGVGAACLVGGAVLYSLGWWRGKQSNTVALVPAVGPDLAGTVLVGAF